MNYLIMIIYENKNIVNILLLLINYLFIRVGLFFRIFMKLCYELCNFILIFINLLIENKIKSNKIMNFSVNLFSNN